MFLFGCSDSFLGLTAMAFGTSERIQKAMTQAHRLKSVLPNLTIVRLTARAQWSGVERGMAYVSVRFGAKF